MMQHALCTIPHAARLGTIHRSTPCAPFTTLGVRTPCAAWQQMVATESTVPVAAQQTAEKKPQQTLNYPLWPTQFQIAASRLEPLSKLFRNYTAQRASLARLGSDSVPRDLVKFQPKDLICCQCVVCFNTGKSVSRFNKSVSRFPRGRTVLPPLPPPGRVNMTVSPNIQNTPPKMQETEAQNSWRD